MKSQILNEKYLDDNTLWTKVIAGDEKSFSILFKRYYKDLVSYANSLLSNSDKVQDCVQDVFADIWVYRNSLQEKVVVKAYLLSCVRKRNARLYERDYVFRKTTTIETIEFLYDFSIENELIADEVTAERVLYLNKLLNDLPPRQKEALYLRYHQGLAVEQISELLDVNYQSANNLLYRGLLNLRKEWANNSLLFSAIFSCFSVFH